MAKFTGIIGGAGDVQFRKFLGTSPDAAKPVPHGQYRCRVTKGEMQISSKGNSGYRLTFEIVGGEHQGRKLWKTYYFTDNARAYSRGELAKFGLVDEGHFTDPFPGDKVIHCTVFVTVTASDRGEQNEVQRIADIVIQGPSGGSSSATPAPQKPAPKKPGGAKGTTKNPATKNPATKNPTTKKPTDKKGGSK